MCLPRLLVNLFLSSFSLHLLSSVTVHQASLQVIRQDECQLWWAAKEMQRGKKLQDYTGKNEKTKLVVKIQKVRASQRVNLWLMTGWRQYDWKLFVVNPLRKGRGHQRGSLWSLKSSRNI